MSRCTRTTKNLILKFEAVRSGRREEKRLSSYHDHESGSPHFEKNSPSGHYNGCCDGLQSDNNELNVSHFSLHTWMTPVMFSLYGLSH